MLSVCDVSVLPLYICWLSGWLKSEIVQEQISVLSWNVYSSLLHLFLRRNFFHSKVFQTTLIAFLRFEGNKGYNWAFNFVFTLNYDFLEFFIDLMQTINFTLCD